MKDIWLSFDAQGRLAGMRSEPMNGLDWQHFRKVEHPNGNEWIECQRIADVEDVHELLKAFSEDPTGDNGVMVVREIRRSVLVSATHNDRITRWREFGECMHQRAMRAEKRVDEYAPQVSQLRDALKRVRRYVDAARIDMLNKAGSYSPAALKVAEESSHWKRVMADCDLIAALLPEETPHG